MVEKVRTICGIPRRQPYHAKVLTAAFQYAAESPRWTGGREASYAPVLICYEQGRPVSHEPLPGKFPFGKWVGAFQFNLCVFLGFVQFP